jgi:transcription antitermination factor NusG
MLPVTDCARSTCNECASSSIAPRWFVVSTYPQAEFQVWAALGHFRRHLPTVVTYRQKMRHGRPVLTNGQRSSEPIIRPFFPGYLFVELDLSDLSWASIGRTQGVKRLMSSPEMRPLPVPVGFVEALMAQGRAGDGAIDPGATPKFPPLAPGDKVCVTVGGTDLDTVVHMSEQERVWVLLRLFDRDVPTEVPRGSVRPV